MVCIDFGSTLIAPGAAFMGWMKVPPYVLVTECTGDELRRINPMNGQKWQTESRTIPIFPDNWPRAQGPGPLPRSRTPQGHRIPRSLGPMGFRVLLGFFFLCGPCMATTWNRVMGSPGFNPVLDHQQRGWELHVSMAAGAYDDKALVCWRTTRQVAGGSLLYWWYYSPCDQEPTRRGGAAALVRNLLLQMGYLPYH